MKMHPKVYLAGPIAGLSWSQATNWRKHASQVLENAGIAGWSPLRGKYYLANEENIKASYEVENQPMSTARGLTVRDRWDVQTSDLVLINLLGAQKPSIGSIVEAAWADSHRIPVVLVMEREGNPNDHPMLRECSSYIFDDLHQALNHVIRFLTSGE